MRLSVIVSNSNISHVLLLSATNVHGLVLSQKLTIIHVLPFCSSGVISGLFPKSKCPLVYNLIEQL